MTGPEALFSARTSINRILEAQGIRTAFNSSVDLIAPSYAHQVQFLPQPIDLPLTLTFRSEQPWVPPMSTPTKQRRVLPRSGDNNGGN